MNKEILTLGELCEKLRICRAEYFKLRKANAAPPSFRLGNRTYFRNSTVDKWLEELENV